MAEKNVFCGVKKASICLGCKKSVGLCSWSHNFVPVDGWKAQEVKGSGYRLPSFCVIECPEFEKEPERSGKLPNGRYKYFKKLIEGVGRDDKTGV